MQTTTGTAAQVTDAVLHITALRSGSEIDRATSRLLADVIGCDDLLHTRVDLTGEGTSVRRGPALVDDGPTSRSLATLGALHPAVASYLVPGDDRSPRRISDVSSTRTWLGGPVYQEVFAARRERYQLSLVTALSPTCGTGWVLTRAARDFTDDDVERAAWLLPTLVALAALSARSTAGPSDPGAPGPPPGRAPVVARLTPRESAVLELVATGASAILVARTLGISERTVRKHLEHLYAKLGVHDRLSAVNVLRGVAPAAAPPPGSA